MKKRGGKKNIGRGDEVSAAGIRGETGSRSSSDGLAGGETGVPARGGRPESRRLRPPRFANKPFNMTRPSNPAPHKHGGSKRLRKKRGNVSI